MFVIYIEEYGYYEGEIYRNDGETYPSARKMATLGCTATLGCATTLRCTATLTIY